MTAARVIAVSGILSATISFIGGAVYHSTLAIGIGSGVMLAGNLLSLFLR